MESSSPPNLFLEMESARAQVPNILRNDYIPVFVVRKLVERLTPDSEAVVVDRGFFGRPKKIESDDMIWSNNTELEDNADFEGLFLLSKDNLNFVGRVLRFACDAVESFGLDKRALGRHFTDEFEHPCLELLYLMDIVYDILPVRTYIMWIKEPYQVKHFKEQFLAFAFSPSAFSNEYGGRWNQILEHFVKVILLTHYCNDSSNANLKNASLITGDILEQITTKLVRDDKGRVEPESHKFVLAMLETVDIPNTVRKRYATDQLHFILRCGTKPFRLAGDILRCQEQFADPGKLIELEYLSSTLQQMLRSSLSAQDVLSLISATISSDDFNWETLLYMISIWIQKGQTAPALLKELIRSQIRHGLTSRKVKHLMSGFILARHCCLVASPVFSRYEKWFTYIFESEKFSPAADLETFKFLTQVLSEWIPNEPSCFLHVHTTFWPFIPPGGRDVWCDYIGLAKARISEYKEVEEAMEYEPNLNDPIQYEVEMAVKSFETNGKVPQSIATMNFLRKQYFLQEFLPVLLRKPTETLLTDARLRLIELLRRNGMIPAEMYTKYKTAQLKS